ncbi:hypothetical protein LCGC14_1810340 [marine sediment metagenome]|uniref:Uncharacterized protein n=1 Tax=marine sediment metagenome TaxID=412755 RepID=A0A0F9GLU3_9ZZZZ
MATYSELFGILGDSLLRNKITVAVGVAAETIRTEVDTTPNHTERVVWSKKAFTGPALVADEILWSVIMANRSLTIAQILGAGDSAIQANVDAVIDHFAV